MLFIYRYIVGFLYVEFSGNMCSKILNICAKNGIILWNSKIIEQKIYTKILLKDFYKLPFLLKHSGIRVHILNKKGFPFYFKKYKKRFGLFVGLIIFVTLLELLSSFIWTVDVVGNKTVDSKEIINACKEIGIYEGAYKKNINVKNEKINLLLKMDKLSWSSINIEGTKATVNVTEIKDKSEEKNFYSNLNASADGIIDKIDISSGTCLVKKGDTVKKGDLLVSGIVEHKDFTSYVHSDGKIIAETDRVIELKTNYKKIEKKENGSFKKRKILYFFGINIPLYFGNENKACNITTNFKELCLNNKKLPIKFYTKTYRYTDNVEEILTKEQVLKELDIDFKNELKRLKINDYTEKNRRIVENAENITIFVEIFSKENIALQNKLLISSGK